MPFLFALGLLNAYYSSFYSSDRNIFETKVKRHTVILRYQCLKYVLYVM